MKPKTTEDVFQLMDGYITSAVVGTAMEMGLFWLLAEKPLPAQNISETLNIPLNRCQNWLLLLCKLDLLEDSTKGYAPTTVARKTILDVYGQGTWAYLAREDRLEFSAVRDLALHICQPRSTWEVQNLSPPDYYKRVLENPTEAARFTRTLYEIHIPLADQLASILDMRGVKKLMDLGGGSGVVSLALLRKQPDLTAVVVDVENVCLAGREIALENGLEGRITYLAADFIEDDLPTGFDMVMFCDAGPFSESLFRKIYDVLNPDGRFVIVEQFALNKIIPAPSHLLWSFLGSLESPAQTNDFTTIDQVQARLEQAGFRDFVTTSVPSKDDLRWNIDWIVLEAHR